MTEQQWADLSAWLREQFRVARLEREDPPAGGVRFRYLVQPDSPLPTLDELDPGLVCYGLAIRDIRVIGHDSEGVTFRVDAA